VFPSTPAGAQARWLLGAVAHAPIPDRDVSAHFNDAFLAQVTPSQLNSGLAGAREPRVVSITSSQTDQLVFIVSVSGAQRIEVNLSVDKRGMIADLVLRPLVSASTPSSNVPAPARPWVAEPVRFDAGGMVVYATYTHPRAAPSGRIPAALLIAGSGAVDRNGNEPGFQVNTLEAVANWLSADGVASLRYDKLGSGQTGSGPYATHPERIGLRPFEQEAAAALRFLARQPSIDRSRLTVIGHSEGALYALLLATGLGENAPKVHTLVLLEPLSIPILDVINQQITAQVAAQRKAGQIDAARARTIEGAVARQVASLRKNARLAGSVPGELATIFNNQNERYLSQVDRYDPAAVAAKLSPHTLVLLSCSDADIQVSCANVDHLAAGLARAHANVDYVHLRGVDHILKEDNSRAAGSYTKALPFSRQLRAALRTFHWQRATRVAASAVTSATGSAWLGCRKMSTPAQPTQIAPRSRRA
jgi:pimeloyl-ACP methyl ester carboxylesterase